MGSNGERGSAVCGWIVLLMMNKIRGDLFTRLLLGSMVKAAGEYIKMFYRKQQQRQQVGEWHYTHLVKKREPIGGT